MINNKKIKPDREHHINCIKTQLSWKIAYN